MIITQATANFLITTIALLFAYSFVVTLSNYAHAWFANRMGDSTPEQLGFLSLNPLDQIDPIGIICVILFQFGWGHYVPINPSNIRGNWYKTKLTCTFLAGSMSYIIIALLTLIILIMLFDPFIIDVTRFMVSNHALSYQMLTYEYPSYASPVIALGFILVGIMYFGVILGVLNGIINGFYLVVALTYDQSPHIMIYNTNVALFLAPILLILFLSGPLRMIVVYLLSYAGYYITTLLGLT